MFLSSLRLSCVAVCVCTGFAAAAAGKNAGWILERGVETPSYAFVEPASTNLNLDTVVLTCEEGEKGAIFQLQLFLKDDGPLLPIGALPSQLKEDPRVEIAIDGRRFGANIYFADEYAVVADSSQGMFPMLSNDLVDAIENGRTMVLRFELLKEAAGKPPAFDGQATVELQAGRGGAAVRAVRRCVNPDKLSSNRSPASDTGSRQSSR